jgi:HTH-type transcriptional regulator, competence development regulator
VTAEVAWSDRDEGGDVAQPSDPQAGKILRIARSRRQWSLRDVERRTGIPNAHLSQIERGRIRQPDIKIIWTLSELYELDFAKMAGWSGHLGPADGANPALLMMAFKALRQLTPEQQIDVIRYIEQLASDQRT